MGRLGRKEIELRDGMGGRRGRKRRRNKSMSGEIEGLIEVLKKDYEKASPEQKEKGKRIASNWRFSRLSYQQKKELQHC